MSNNRFIITKVNLPKLPHPSQTEKIKAAHEFYQEAKLYLEQVKTYISKEGIDQKLYIYSQKYNFFAYKAEETFNPQILLRKGLTFASAAKDMGYPDAENLISDIKKHLLILLDHPSLPTKNQKFNIELDSEFQSAVLYEDKKIHFIDDWIKSNEEPASASKKNAHLSNARIKT